MNQLIYTEPTFEFLDPSFCDMEDAMRIVKECYCEVTHLLEMHYIRGDVNNLELLFDELNRSYTREWAARRALLFDDIPHVITRAEVEKFRRIEPIADLGFALNFYHHFDVGDDIGEPYYKDIMRVIQLLRLHVFYEGEVMFMPKWGVW